MPAADTPTETLELPIEGMSCASCAQRVEKRLNGLDSVSASVNYATERASISFDPARVVPDDLVAAVEATGYHARLPQPDTETGTDTDPDTDSQAATPRDRELDTLRRRLQFATVLSLPVLLLSMVSALQFDGWQWFALALATPVVLWAGLPFHRAALLNLRHRAATMDTLISIGTLAAWAWSIVALVVFDAANPAHDMHFELLPARGEGTASVYLEVAAVVTTFVLAGRFLELRAKRRAGAAIEALLHLGAKTATLLDDDGSERTVAISALTPGQRFIVRPGEKVATDGVVEQGSSAIDRSIITGESVPVDVGPGDEVIGATLNSGGRLIVRATRVGKDTALAQIARLVTEAQSGKAPVQRLADRISAVFVPLVLLLAAATLAAWLVSGANLASAFSATVAVLIVACPCALGLATPTALLVGTGRGAQLGVLIKGPEVLESTRRVDTIVLDKTGTITTGVMTLQSVTCTPETDEAEALRLAGALEAASEHPIARAIAAAARTAATDTGGALPHADDFQNREGLGVEGTVDGVHVLVGRPELLTDRGLALPAELERAVLDAEHTGGTAVAAGWDGAARAVYVVADTMKPTSADAIAELRALGLRPVLLTGDNEQAARTVADAVGIEEVIAGVLPAGKADAVRELQRQGRVVAMVGDGVNDAPALAQADLGLAIGTGTDVAIESSDITLVSGDLRAAGDAIRLSRRTLRTIKGNLFWAFAYNVAALPLAATGYLNPLVAGAAMAFSSVFVVSNSLRLRSFRSPRE